VALAGAGILNDRAVREVTAAQLRPCAHGRFTWRGAHTSSNPSQEQPTPAQECSLRFRGVTVTRRVGRWPLQQVAVQRIFLGCSLGCQPELGRDRQPGGQGQLLAVARTSHSLTSFGLTGVGLTSTGAGTSTSPAQLAGPAIDGDQAAHRGQQQDRSKQTDAGFRYKWPGDQVGDRDSYAPGDQQPASAMHLRSPADAVHHGGAVQDGHACERSLGQPHLGVGEPCCTVRLVDTTRRFNERHRDAQ